jgi:hypothetical protein
MSTDVQPDQVDWTDWFAAQDAPPDFDFHVAALHDAGFREVGTIWQVLSDRVLPAVR